jgi:hypothetical protein
VNVSQLRLKSEKFDNNSNDVITPEIQRMWNVKTEVIPLIIWTTGTISTSFTNQFSNRTGITK